MAGEIGFSGIASGLDTEMLIESMLVSKQKRVSNVEDTLSKISKQKTAITDLKRVLGVLNSSASDLGSVILGNKSAESSNETFFTAKANSDAALGSYDIEVTTLAQKSVATIGNTVASTSESIGSGTLTLNLSGGDSYSVTLSSSSTILDLRDALNNQYKEDINASVIETSPGQYQLLVSTVDSGANQNILGTSSMSGFSSPFIDAGVANTQTGRDSSFSLDGIAITRTSNEITDLIDGVTLTLKGQTTNTETLTISSNTDEIVSGLEDFTAAYNDAVKMITDLSGSEGVMVGDSTLRTLKSKLQSMISNSVPNIGTFNQRADGTTGFTSLSQIGFKTDRNTGELSIDTEDLTDALKDHFTEVENLFKGGTSSTNSNVEFTGNTGIGFSGTVLLDTQNDTATIDGQLYNMIRNGDTLTFADGSTYDGMVFYATVSDPSVTIEISQGLGSMMHESTDEFVSFSGILNDKSDSLNEQEERLNDRQDHLQEIVDNERLRLRFIFAKSEQALSELQAMQSSLGSL